MRLAAAPGRRFMSNDLTRRFALVSVTVRGSERKSGTESTAPQYHSLAAGCSGNGRQVLIRPGETDRAQDGRRVECGR